MPATLDTLPDDEAGNKEITVHELYPVIIIAVPAGMNTLPVNAIYPSVHALRTFQLRHWSAKYITVPVFRFTRVTNSKDFMLAFSVTMTTSPGDNVVHAARA